MLAALLGGLIPAIAPVLPHMAEDAWQALPYPAPAESVFLVSPTHPLHLSSSAAGVVAQCCPVRVGTSMCPHMAEDAWQALPYPASAESVFLVRPCTLCHEFRLTAANVGSVLPRLGLQRMSSTQLVSERVQHLRYVSACL